jgi:hypothetical protein
MGKDILVSDTAEFHGTDFKYAVSAHRVVRNWVVSHCRTVFPPHGCNSCQQPWEHIYRLSIPNPQSQNSKLSEHCQMPQVEKPIPDFVTGQSKYDCAKRSPWLGMVVHTCNPSKREVEKGGLWVSGQSGLHKENLYQKSVGETWTDFMFTLWFYP